MPFGIRLLNRLAAASFALGSCAALPTDALADWVEAELENEPDTTPLHAVSTAGKLAAGARSAIVALWSKSPEATESFVSRLLVQDASAPRIAAAGALAQILELASPMQRIEIVCRWVVSDDVRERLTISRALSLPTRVFVADLAIGELSRDESAEVRAAAARAARVHAETDPEAFGAILAELSQDPVSAVRAAADSSHSGAPLA
jgi:hypothetical protein